MDDDALSSAGAAGATAEGIEALDAATRERRTRTVERWLSEHRDAMMQTARRFEGRIVKTDDIVQVASMEALSKAHQAPTVHRPEAWLRSFARRVGLRVVAKRARREGLDEACGVDCPDWARGGHETDDIEEMVSRSEERDRVLALVPCLPASLREVVLGMLDDMEDDELAECLKIARSTVRVRRLRAVHRLREEMGAEASS